jgi:hypothetical protein
MAPSGDVSQEITNTDNTPGAPGVPGDASLAADIPGRRIENEIARESDPAAAPDLAASEIERAPSGIDAPADVAAPIATSPSAHRSAASDRGTSSEARIPTHQEIEIRAYFLSRARPDVDPVALWLTAERQLREEYSKTERERADQRVIGGGVRPLGEPPSDRRA